MALLVGIAAKDLYQNTCERDGVRISKGLKALNRFTDFCLSWGKF